ncbi:hypothetical protein APHAL10511_000155 [Amanita phalloides]|nr:hypothetical protein APHAL10511_000155 [Amanita phalloides]
MATKISPYKSYGTVNAHSGAEDYDVVANEAGSLPPPPTDTRTGRLHRSLSSRQVQMIAIAGTIGTGLFLGTGRSLAQGGPASILICYTVIGFIVYVTLLLLGEMATQYPVAGSFNAYAVRFFSPAYGFALSWNYWFNDAVSVASDLTAAQLVMQYWTDWQPWTVSLSIWILLVAVNATHVGAYGELEYWISSIKVITVVAFVITGIFVNAGMNSDHRFIGFDNWRIPGAPFVDGFKGFAGVFVTASFAFGGTESLGITAGETKNPSRNMPRVVKFVFWRITIFYVLSILIIGLNVPYCYPNLSNRSTTTSPFTIVFKEAGSTIAATSMNTVVLSSAVSAGNHALFAGTRVLYGLAEMTPPQAPRIFSRTTAQGVPLAALLMTSSVSVICLGASYVGSGVLWGWLQNIVGVSNQIAWFSIGIASWRFRKAWVRQGRSLDELKFRAAWTWPWGPPFVIISVSTLILVQGWSSFIPKFSPTDFASYYIELLVMIVMFIIWRTLSLRWPQVNPENSGQTPLLIPAASEAAHIHSFWSGDVVDLDCVDLTRDEYIGDEIDKKDDEQINSRLKGANRWLWHLYYWLLSLACNVTSSYRILNSPQISTASQERTSRRHDRYASDAEREIRHLRELLQLERQRAEDAEARTRESLAHLKSVNEARIKALQEASQATEEVKLYKIQLEAAQIDIYRAQDILKVVDKQRLDAEKEAAELRTRHRQLVEETKVQRAREQGRQQGMKEGIEKGRDLGLLEGRLMGYGQRPSPQSRQRAFEDDEPLSPDSNISSSTARTTASRFAPPSPRPASRTNSVAPSVVSRRSVGGRSESDAPVPTSSRSSATQGMNDGTDYSRRNRAPSPVHSTTFVPPDNYIPFADADNVIRLPPPHEFQRPPSTSERSSSPLHDSETDDRRQTNSRTGTPYRRARRHSSPESNSTTISQLDLVNDPSHNQVLGTPMSAIPEVSSSQTSPAQQHELQRRPSFAGSTGTQGSQRSAAAYGTPADLRVPIYTRPRTTSGSTISAVPPSGAPQHERSQSTLGSGPPISVQPPSSPSSGTIANESTRISTPAGRLPAPLPAEPPSLSMPSPPPERSEFPSPIVLNSNELPPNFVAMNYTPGSSFAQFRPMSNEGNTSSDGPPVIPDSALFGMDSEDSEGSMDTLTTPPPDRRRIDLHETRSSSRNSHYGGARTSSVVGTPRSARVAAQVPLPPSTIAGTPKSTRGGASGVGAAGIPLPPSTVAGTPSAVGEGVSLPTAPNTSRWGGSMGKIAGNKSRSSSRSTRRTAN